MRGCRSHPPCQEVEKCHPTKPTPNSQVWGYSRELKAPLWEVVRGAVMVTMKVMRLPSFPAGSAATEHLLCARHWPESVLCMSS